MRVNVALFELLRSAKAMAAVVLATDNMDCFADTFHRVRTRHRHLTTAAEPSPAGPSSAPAPSQPSKPKILTDS